MKKTINAMPDSPEPKKSGPRRKSTSTNSTTASAVPLEIFELDPETSEFLSNMIQNGIAKYTEANTRLNKESRDDFIHLQNYASEFLNDFLIIGHSLDDQRVVMRYAVTPGDLDKLTELSRKVLIRTASLEQDEFF